MSTTFNQVKESNLKLLKQYVPIVDRVHGDNHPEFHDVLKTFNNLKDKIDAAGQDKPDLNKEFGELREITSNYKIPNDVCDTFRAVYNMLSELDNAYQD
jgi:regulator of cell morphogenesis and NO signaling